MKSASQCDRSQPRLPRAAIASGLIAVFVTAGAVSWATPDGNLIVTLVPALAVGLAVFGLVSWRFRRGARRRWRVNTCPFSTRDTRHGSRDEA